MNRRDALTTTFPVIGGILFGTGMTPQPPDPATTTAAGGHALRAVWKWYGPTREWVRCRMDTLKPGDTMSMEEQPGSKRRWLGRVESHPRYLPDGACEVIFTGEQIEV